MDGRGERGDLGVAGRELETKLSSLSDPLLMFIFLIASLSEEARITGLAAGALFLIRDSVMVMTSNGWLSQ